MEKIKAKVSANYDDREVSGNCVDINFATEEELIEDEEENIWFNIPVSNKREDDYITVSMKIEDLLHAIGKVVQKP